MEWVVGPFGIQADFDVVVRAFMLRQNLPHLAAEVSLDLQYQPAQLRLRIGCAISHQLIGERIHAATCLPATDSTDDDCAGE